MHFGKNMRTYYLILIPILVLFFAFNTFPLINGLIYSFTNSKGYGGFDWIGFRNYGDLFTDARVGNSYLFTFKMAVVGTIVINVLSLILALALNSKIKFKTSLRGLYFIPNILGALVVGYVFNYFFTYILPFLTSPIAAVFLAITALSITLTVRKELKMKKTNAIRTAQAAGEGVSLG